MRNNRQRNEEGGKGGDSEGTQGGKTLKTNLRKIMKWLHFKSNLSLFLTVALIIFAGYYIKYKINGKMCDPEYMFNHPIKVVIPVVYKFSVEDGATITKINNVRLTSYTNRIEETDSTPNWGASDRMVYEGSCAVSQDLFRHTIFPGDIIYVKKLKRYFIVEDTLNQRFTNSLDVFMFKTELSTSNAFGLQYSDIYVMRVKR